MLHDWNERQEAVYTAVEGDCPDCGQSSLMVATLVCVKCVKCQWTIRWELSEEEAAERKQHILQRQQGFLDRLYVGKRIVAKKTMYSSCVIESVRVDSDTTWLCLGDKEVSVAEASMYGREWDGVEVCSPDGSYKNTPSPFRRDLGPAFGLLGREVHSVR